MTRRVLFCDICIDELENTANAILKTQTLYVVAADTIKTAVRNLVRCFCSKQMSACETSTQLVGGCVEFVRFVAFSKRFGVHVPTCVQATT